MAKREDTLRIERSLVEMTKDKGIYGCEEITIGFVNQGHGNEIVDFMTMDSKGTIKCYEIKVTLQDLKSKAKKSWYGNYNYLVVSKELYDKVKDFSQFIPDHVGVIVGRYLENVRKAKRVNIDNDTNVMLKESLVRSMYWKMIKYKKLTCVESKNDSDEDLLDIITN